jgi:hypothetical protein
MVGRKRELTGRDKPREHLLVMVSESSRHMPISLREMDLATRPGSMGTGVWRVGDDAGAG